MIIEYHPITLRFGVELGPNNKPNVLKDSVLLSHVPNGSFMSLL